MVRLHGLTCSIGISIAMPVTPDITLAPAHLMEASRPTESLSMWVRLPNELRGGEAQWRSGRRAFDFVLTPSRVRSGSLGRTQPRVEFVSAKQGSAPSSVWLTKEQTSLLHVSPDLGTGRDPAAR
jgi:hypothetical protein